MSTTTPRMYFPEIAASQAQKEVTHNEDLQMLDCFTFCAVQDKDQVNPPTTSDGISYIVAVGGASTWTGHDGEIAQMYNSAWNYYTPGEGWRAWVKDEDLIYVYSGSAWGALTPITNKVQVITVTSSSVAIDWTAGHIATMTLETVKDIAFYQFSGASEGDKLVLRIRQGTTGGGTATMPASVRYGADITSITLSTSTGKQDYIGFLYDSTGKYDVVAVIRGY